MYDSFGRKIDYLRLSVTDRCNLRCRYCMPETGVEMLARKDILRNEEIIRLVKIFAALGITKIKVTGGEPLVRKGVVGLIREIGAIDGIEDMTLTTNGILLDENIFKLKSAGIKAITISLDTLNRERYELLTGRDEFRTVAIGLDCAAALMPAVRVKINCVPFGEHGIDDALEILEKVRDYNIDVRFIELMPMGEAAGMERIPIEDVKAAIEGRFGRLTPIKEKRGNGPAEHYRLVGFSGAVGFIAAISHTFCAGCNRLRLTADGQMKLCLAYDYGLDLRAMLRGGASDSEISDSIERAVLEKPKAHAFTTDAEHKEKRRMSRIGG